MECSNPTKSQALLMESLVGYSPSWFNLCKKGVVNVGKCQRCGLLENNSRVLEDCSWTQEVWLKIMSSSDIPQYTSFREWLGATMEQINQR